MATRDLNHLLPCSTPVAYGLDSAQEAIRGGSYCPHEFAFGCIVPFEVEIPVSPNATVEREIKPYLRLLPVAMVAYLSGPDIRIEALTRRDDRPAGMTGSGITQTRDPDSFDWESLKTPYNPFPPDIGPVDSSKGFRIKVSNLTGTEVQMFVATFFGAVGGRAGLNFIRDNIGMSSQLYDSLCEWLHKSDIRGDGKVE